MEKDTFIFRREWRDAISGLPREVRLEVYEAIIEYALSGETRDLKPTAGLAFNFAKAAIDQDARRAAVSRKRAEAGRRHRGNQYTAGRTSDDGGDVKKMEQNGTKLEQKWNKSGTKMEQNGTNFVPPCPPSSFPPDPSYNNPLTPSSSSSSSPAPAHAGDGGRLDAETMEALADETWTESMRMRHRLSGSELAGLADEFRTDCLCRGTTEHWDLGDYKRHFNDWLIKRKQHDRLQQQDGADRWRDSSQGDRITAYADVAAGFRAGGGNS